MPIYEYECEACRKVVEIWQAMSEAPLAACPECQAPVKKIISQSAFHLKGGGWYSDGYSNTSGKAATCGDTTTEKKAACPNAASCPCAS